ncbi:MAG: ATP-binding protein [Tepidisphaeraceae bacterium]
MPADVVLHFVFPSVFAPMREVQRQIISAVESQRFDDDSLFAIKISLEEALVNAVKHGNKLDPKKTVTVDLKVNPQEFWIKIHDQGAGFDPSKVPDPLADENLEKPSGRGLLLIGNYMTTAKYTDGGRCLTMTKKNGCC